MSVDLSRPQVAGISPHDALDGCVTFRQLSRAGAPGEGAALEEEIGTLRALSAERDWGTSDPLGIGGVLLDAFRIATLPDRTAADEGLIRDVLAGADAGLQEVLHTVISLRVPLMTTREIVCIGVRKLKKALLQEQFCRVDFSHQQRYL